MREPKRRKLTRAQQKLAGDNIRLAYKVVFRNRSLWRGEDSDDELNSAAMDLCRAAADYDPSRGTRFSTLACTYVFRGMLQRFTLRQRNDRCKTARTTREALAISHAIDPVPTRLQDEEDIEHHEYRVDVVEQLLSLVDHRSALALTLYHLEGLTLAKTGLILGVSKERVRQLLKRARQQIRDRSVVMRRQLAFCQE